MSSPKGKKRSRGAMQILVQAAFLVLACLICTFVLLLMMQRQFTDEYAKTLREQILQYSAMAARTIPQEAVTSQDEQAGEYLKSFLDSLYISAGSDPGARIGYGLYKVEGEGITPLALSDDVAGPSGSDAQYINISADGELWDDGEHLSALYPIMGEDGQMVGVVETVCDWSQFVSNTQTTRTMILYACAVGIVCMLIVYLVMAFFTATRERNRNVGGIRA